MNRKLSATLATLAGVAFASVTLASSATATATAASGAASLAPLAVAAERPAEVEALVGKWHYVGDLTPGRDDTEKRPNHGGSFTIALDGAVVVVEQSSGATPLVLRLPLDGGEFAKKEGDTSSTYRARFEAGAWRMEVRSDAPGKSKGKREVTVSSFVFTLKEESLEVASTVGAPAKSSSVCLYKKPEDIESRDPVAAKIGEVAWLVGNWSGTQQADTIEERWSQPAGGALLATARTIRGGKMVAFEFLRIVERGAKLLFVAQPNGAPPTEFTLVELDGERAIFENPLSDYPQRITYERVDEQLTAEICLIDGGQPVRFDFTRAK
ncbi:MAG: hypothetical protein JNL90_12195 [Planctomycetes bacterium]|nr:hypothetical protein [Planctomycetota bacterium]